MSALQLTAYEMGLRDPAEHFPAERRVKVIRREAKPLKRGPSPAERDHRQQLANRAREQFASTEDMARVVGSTGGSISKWFNGSRPVPDRYVATLERITGGEA